MSIEFQVENAYLLSLAQEKGIDIRSFDQWKLVGKFVRRGEKQMRVRVQAGSRSFEDAITGNMIAEPIFKYAYGFTAKQVA